MIDMKNNGIKKIFLILGDACNMQCMYCKAYCNANKTGCLEKIIMEYPTPDVMSYLKATIESEPTLINFYGGEPLLYFDVIRYVIEKLDIPKGKVIWSTMTNGKAITAEKVDFFNENGVTVNFSWDGSCTQNVRGYDVFENQVLKNHILDINELWINSTLTSLNSPLEIANSHEPYLKEYQKRHGKPYGINIGLATPTQLNDPLYKYDYEKIYTEMKYIFREFVIAGTMLPIDKLRAIDCIAMTLIHRLRKKALGIRDICLDMDIKGNFLTCPFSRKVVDTLDTQDLYIEKAQDLAEKRRCKEDCPLTNICDGGCPQLKGTLLGKEGCDLRKAFYMPLMEMMMGQLFKE